MNARPYKRLPGRYWGLGYGTSLWEGGDHLLLVKWVLVSEAYNRFYFRDIQAIAICRTRSWIILGALLGAATLLLGIPAILNAGFLRWFLGIPAVILLIATALNFWGGPTCKTTIQTAVQNQQIRSLHRLKNARKIVARLQDKIASAQAGQVT